MKRLRILIDIDGILAETLPLWLEFICDRTGLCVGTEHITEWELHRCPPLDTVDPKEIYSILNDPGFYLLVQIMAGAKTALELLNPDHDIYLVTARSGPTAIQETKEWVKTRLPFINIEKNLIFCYDKHLIKGDVLIDDKAETLVRYHNEHPKAKTLTITYPYNDGVIVDLRVPSGELAWGMIYQYITQLAKEEDS